MAEDGENDKAQDIEEKKDKIRQANVSFSNAGKHSESLGNIYSSLLEIKRKNGDIQTVNDEIALADEIGNAYKQIKAIAETPEAIDIAMENFQKVVESGNNMENIPAIVSTYASKAREEVIREQSSYANNKTVAVVGTAVAVGALTQAEKHQKIVNQYENIKQNSGKFFIEEFVSKKTLDKVDELEKDAPDTAGTMKSAIKGLAKTLEFDQAGHLPEGGAKRAALAQLMRIAATGETAEIDEILTDMAQKQGFDEVLISTEDGTVTGIDRSKLEKLFNKKAKEANPKFKEKTIEDFKEVNERKAKREKQIPETEEQSLSMAEKVKKYSKEGKRLALFSVIRNATKIDDLEEVERIFRENPEDATELLKRTVKTIEEAKERGKKPDILEKQLGTWNEVQKKLNQERQNNKNKQNRSNSDNNNNQRRPQGDDGMEH